jgi:hypothetical protein
MEIIILLLFILSIKKWLPKLFVFLILLVFFPFIPFYVAYSVRNEQPRTAITILALNFWIYVFLSYVFYVNYSK